MLALCGPTWWRKPENPGKTTEPGRATTTLPHALTRIRTWIAVVTSECVIHYAIQAIKCWLKIEHVPPLQIPKTRIRDQVVQHWYSQINNFSKLHYYAQNKSEFKFEKYLQVIENEKIRKRLTAFRVSAIERGRYWDKNGERRLCNLCNLKQVESEYHFLLICPFYAALRQSYLGRTPWPSMLKVY